MDQVQVAAFDELDAATLYSILRLRSAVFVIEQQCVYEDIDGRDTEPGTRHLWITDPDDRPVAYLRLLDEPDGVARIGRVCVARSARGSGLAGALMEAALRAIGGAETVLDAQTYATRLYTNAGFAPDGEVFVEDGIPHLPMRRPAGPVI